jgi:hypothetical protein
MAPSSLTRRTLALAAAFLMLTLLALPAVAQQKEEETPFWAIGRPKAGPGAQMAPVPAFPVPTPADKLPIAKMKVPEGFKVEVYAAEILDARGPPRGRQGHGVRELAVRGGQALRDRRQGRQA